MQSKSQLGDDLEKRVQYTLTRSFKAIIVTSSTTFGAFLANGLSNIVPIAAFGIWAAWVVMADFLLIITVYPCCIVLWEIYFDNGGMIPFKWEQFLLYKIKLYTLHVFSCFKGNLQNSTPEGGRDYCPPPLASLVR